MRERRQREGRICERAASARGENVEGEGGRPTVGCAPWVLNHSRLPAPVASSCLLLFVFLEGLKRKIG